MQTERHTRQHTCTRANAPVAVAMDEQYFRQRGTHGGTHAPTPTHLSLSRWTSSNSDREAHTAARRHPRQRTCRCRDGRAVLRTERHTRQHTCTRANAPVAVAMDEQYCRQRGTHCSTPRHPRQPTCRHGRVVLQQLGRDLPMEIETRSFQMQINLSQIIV
jgi:hypothetical protein